MSFEVIPESYRRPFDPLADADHELVRFYTQGRLTTGRGVQKEIQRLYSFNRIRSEDLMDRLLNYGRFLEPFNDELQAEDEYYGRTRTFFAGTAVALASTANLAYELNVDQSKWRSEWAQLPTGIDAPISVMPGSLSTPDDCFRIGAALINVGSRNLAAIEPTYREMIDTLESEYSADGMHGNIFRASYGYVFGIGRRVIRDMIYQEAIETTVLELIPDAAEPTSSGLLDEDLKRLLAEDGPHV